MREYSYSVSSPAGLLFVLLLRFLVVMIEPARHGKRNRMMMPMAAAIDWSVVQIRLLWATGLNVPPIVCQIMQNFGCSEALLVYVVMASNFS